MIREKFKAMAEWPWQTTWEEFSGGSKAHCYGMYPAYFLSAYVLGVRLDGPVSGRALLIDPRLGDLSSAQGTVVTEFGPVPVSWRRSGDRLDFEFTVPEEVKATFRLPSGGGTARLVMDNQSVATNGPVSSTPSVQVKAGRHKGVILWILPNSK
jgi:alpha-L-rhamnosidase